MASQPQRSPLSPLSPLSQSQMLDASFMEHRAQILAIAAFLDRLERAREHDAEDDFRLKAFREALQLLTSGEGERVKRIQLALSDLDLSLLDERDQQSAYGAPIRGHAPGPFDGKEEQ